MARHVSAGRLAARDARATLLQSARSRVNAHAPAPGIPHESCRRRARRSWTKRPHAVPRARAGGASASTWIWSASKGRRAAARDHRRAADHGPPLIEASTLRKRGGGPAPATRSPRSSMPRGSSLRLWRTLRALPPPDLVLVQNPPAFPTLAVDVVRRSAPRRALRHRLAQPRLHAAAAASGPVASGRAAGALVRAAGRAARRREPLRVARPRAVPRDALRRRKRAACSTTGRRRPSRRSIAPTASSTARRCSRASASARGAVGFIVCPTSWTEDEDFDVVIDAVLLLEERIRGWEAAGRRGGFPTS